MKDGLIQMQTRRLKLVSDVSSADHQEVRHGVRPSRTANAAGLTEADRVAIKQALLEIVETYGGKWPNGMIVLTKLSRLVSAGTI